MGQADSPEAPILKYRISPRRPYSLALTAARYARFPDAVDRFDGRTYERLLPVGRGAVLLSVRQAGGPTRAFLDVSLEGSGAESPLAREAARRVVEGALGAGTDVRDFYRDCGADPILAAAIRDFPGMRIAGWPSLWEALVTAILSQQINLRFAYAMRHELSSAFGRRARRGGRTHTAFPSPRDLASLTPRALRRMRVSGAKAGTILGLARAFASGDLSEAELAPLSDEAAIDRLMSFRGVGRWTAEIALLRGLGRTDIFPAGDLSIVKYLAVGLLGRGSRAAEKDMRDFARRWEPHRGLALVYAYAELARREGDRPLSPGSRLPPRLPRERSRPPESARSRTG